MKGIIKHIFCLLFLGVQSVYGQNIAEISFEGLTKTKETFLRSIIECEEGMTFDSTTFEMDVQNIKNLNLFFDVRSSINEDKKGHYILEIVCREALSIYPIIDAGFEKENYYLQLGASDLNWLGEGKTLGAFYRYYDRHSFAIYQKTPRHKNKKTGHAFSVAKYSTVEPLYFGNTSLDFNYDLYSVNLTGFFNINYFNTIELGNTYFHERYNNISNVEIENLEGDKFSFDKHAFKLGYLFNKVNFDYERLDGFKSYLAIEDVITYGIKANFIKVNSELNYYKAIQKKGNLAIRQRIGMATNVNSPFSPFVLDNYVNVRGVGNRVERGSAEYILNVEYRHSWINKEKFILQSVNFIDMGTLRPPGQPFSKILSNDVSVFAGIGIRLHSRIIYNTVIRLDFGVNMNKPSETGFVFGMGQYF